MQTLNDLVVVESYSTELVKFYVGPLSELDQWYLVKALRGEFQAWVETTLGYGEVIVTNAGRDEVAKLLGMDRTGVVRVGAL